jgi:hypothetical protein
MEGGVTLATVLGKERRPRLAAVLLVLVVPVLLVAAVWVVMVSGRELQVG